MVKQLLRVMLVLALLLGAHGAPSGGWLSGAEAHAAQALVFETGQTTSYAAGDDGALRPGVAWPAPRFSDNGNGAVTDNLTGLIWLKNANCTDTAGGIDKSNGYLVWANALTWSNSLASGKCGLTDGSSAGAWRLPNAKELESLVDLQNSYPSFPAGHPFQNVQANFYWSSSSYAHYPAYAWYVGMGDGYVGYDDKNSGIFYVWPVRGGQGGALDSLALAPTSYDYGTLTSGDEPNVAIITLKNNGSSSATPAAATLVTDDPASLKIINNTCSQQNLAPGASCAITVQFAPLAYKAYTGTLQITVNSKIYSAALQGKSVATGALYNTYILTTTLGGVPNTSLLGSANGDNDYLSSAERTDLDNHPSVVTHALYPVEFYTQKTADQSCRITANGNPEPQNDTRQPLILIHGWQGGSPTGDMDYPTVLCDDAQLGETYWNNFIQYFNASPTLREKYRLYVYHYPSYKHVTFNARVLARILQRNVYIKSWIANGGKISILAHSMGGLVSRSLLEEHLSGEDAAHSYQYTQPDSSTVSKSGLDVLDKLVTVATPHHGSPGALYWWAHTSPNWAGSTAWIAKNLFSPGSQDLFWDNYDGVFANIFENNKSLAVNFLPPGVDFTNSARIEANTSFDNYYRMMLSNCPINNEYKGYFYYMDGYTMISSDATFNRYPNPWLSLLNKKFKLNKQQYVDKYVFISGYNDGNNSSVDNRVSDAYTEVADDLVYEMGYINDWAVPLTSGSLDFSKEAIGLGPFDLNPDLFPQNVAGGKAVLFPEFLSDHSKVIHAGTVNNIPVRVLKDYHHDRLLNGGYKSSSTDLLDSSADSGFNDGGGRTLYLDQSGFKHPGYISRTFPSKLTYEPVFQVIRSFLAPVTYQDSVQNGDFENGGALWSQSTSGIITNVQQLGQNGGNNGSAWYAALGGVDTPTSAISQDIAIPANALSAKLSYAYQLRCSSGMFYNYLITLQVVSPSNGSVLQTLKTFSNADVSTTWVSAEEFDLSAYKGQTIRIRFSTSIADGALPYYPATLLVDDVRLITTESDSQLNKLTVTLSGTGSGTVTSDPPGISCTSGSCSSDFSNGASVNLIPTVSVSSAFGGWSGACTNKEGTCSVLLTGDKSVAASFVLAPKAKIGGNGYASFLDAYNAAGNNATIMLLEDWLPNLTTINKNLILQGGYNADFSRSASGYTTLQAPLTIGSGSIVVDRVVIAPLSGPIF